MVLVIDNIESINLKSPSSPLRPKSPIPEVFDIDTFLKNGMQVFEYVKKLSEVECDELSKNLLEYFRSKYEDNTRRIYIVEDEQSHIFKKLSDNNNTGSIIIDYAMNPKKQISIKYKTCWIIKITKLDDKQLNFEYTVPIENEGYISNITYNDYTWEHTTRYKQYYITQCDDNIHIEDRYNKRMIAIYDSTLKYPNTENRYSTNTSLTSESLKLIIHDYQYNGMTGTIYINISRNDSQISAKTFDIIYDFRGTASISIPDYTIDKITDITDTYSHAIRTILNDDTIKVFPDIKKSNQLTVTGEMMYAPNPFSKQIRYSWIRSHLKLKLDNYIIILCPLLSDQDEINTIVFTENEFPGFAGRYMFFIRDNNVTIFPKEIITIDNLIIKPGIEDETLTLIVEKALPLTHGIVQYGNRSSSCRVEPAPQGDQHNPESNASHTNPLSDSDINIDQDSTHDHKLSIMHPRHICNDYTIGWKAAELSTGEYCIVQLAIPSEAMIATDDELHKYRASKATPYRIVSLTDLCRRMLSETSNITFINGSDNFFLGTTLKHLNNNKDITIVPADICGICLNNMSCDVVSTPCSHKFCYECMNVWLNQKFTCPLCSQHIHPNELIHQSGLTVGPLIEITGDNIQSSFIVNIAKVNIRAIEEFSLRNNKVKVEFLEKEYHQLTINADIPSLQYILNTLPRDKSLIAQPIVSHKKIQYIVDEPIEVLDFDPDLNNVCTTGIHYHTDIKDIFQWFI